MKRTQLYLDDQLWNVLHAQALTSGTTISELVRQSLRKHYLGDLGKRQRAMQAVVGIREDAEQLLSAEEEVRSLRGGSRLQRVTHA